MEPRRGQGARAVGASGPRRAEAAGAEAHDGSRVEELFHEALALTGQARADFLDRACKADPSLRAEVETLIESDARATRFLSTPAVVEFFPTERLAVEGHSGSEPWGPSSGAQAYHHRSMWEDEVQPERTTYRKLLLEPHRCHTYEVLGSHNEELHVAGRA